MLKIHQQQKHTRLYIVIEVSNSSINTGELCRVEYWFDMILFPLMPAADFLPTLPVASE